MKTMTLREGVLRLLDGEQITIMVPQDLGTTWLEDLLEMQKLGAYCIYTKDLNVPGTPEPEVPSDTDSEVGQAEEEKLKKTRIDTGACAGAKGK